jgi:hypothetical protein
MAYGRDQVGRQWGAFERDPQRQGGRIASARPLSKGSICLRERRGQTRIDRFAVKGMVRRRVEAAGSEVGLARADEPARGHSFGGLGRKPVAGRHPCLVESGIVAAADGARPRLDLAEIRPAIRNVGDRPDAHASPPLSIDDPT